jgi:hypothetical protein
MTPEAQTAVGPMRSGPRQSRRRSYGCGWRHRDQYAYEALAFGMKIVRPEGALQVGNVIITER